MRPTWLLSLLLLVVVACAPRAVAPPRTPETPISADVVTDVLREAFPTAVASGRLVLTWPPSSKDEAIEELRQFGVANRGQFAALIPADYEARGIGAKPDPTNVLGLVRHLMIIADAQHYVNVAWKEHWASSRAELPALEAYGVDWSVLEKAGVVR